MHYSERQIKYILKNASKNVQSAIVRNGTVFIDDISLEPGLRSYTAKLTFRGTPIDLRGDEENLKRATALLYRAYGIEGRRGRIRDLFQKLSDNLARNYKLDQMSEEEIAAWFALDKIGKNISKVKICRVGYMYKIRLGNLELSHLPSEANQRIFMVLFNDKLVDISLTHSNKYLYERASNVFFEIYAKRIQTK